MMYAVAKIGGKRIVVTLFPSETMAEQFAAIKNKRYATRRPSPAAVVVPIRELFDRFRDFDIVTPGLFD